MNESRFFDVIAARTGLEIRAKDHATVLKALAERARLRDLNTDDYLEWLVRASPESEQEWRVLTPALTNGESYFWRDRGQFALLCDTILPALLRERGGALRLWSAGCSSGEEAYSLAMLVHEVRARDDSLPARKVHILGTDLNERAIERARQGVYGPWSFRGVDDDLRARYFEQMGQEWRVRSSVRAGVHFQQLNLCDSSAELRDFDLIVCRNVLIYLTSSAVNSAVANFARALRPGAYLLCGHAELTGRDLSGLTPRLFPQSAIYQKAPAFHATAIPAQALPRVERVARTVAPRQCVSPSPVAPRQTTKAEPKAQVEAAKIEAQSQALARAQQWADRGAHEEALELCRAIIESDSCCWGAYLLWAHIEIERGQSARAKTLLKKVIYLAPTQTRSYLELAALYDAENDEARAATMRAAAAKMQAQN